MQKVKTYILKHKIISGLAVLVLIFVAYRAYAAFTNTSGETRYVTAMVQKGTIIASVTGTGQVSSSNQVDLQPKASGQVISVPVTEGQQVSQGAVIIQIDNQDAVKSVRDAETSLQSAQLSLQKLQEPADQLSLTQAQDNVSKANESKQSAQDDLVKAYNDGFTNVSNTFLNLPTIMTSLQNMLLGSNTTLVGNTGESNIDYYTSTAEKYDNQAMGLETDAETKYQTARTAYDQTFQAYKAVTLSSDTSTIEGIVDQTYSTTQDIAEAIKSADNLIQFYEDKLTAQNLQPKPQANNDLSALNTYTGQVNTSLSNLLGSQTTIKSDTQAISDADRTITENTQSLQKLQSGADPIDLQTAQLNVKQKQDALLDAQQTLENYVVRAPFDGTIAKVDAKKGDTVGSGTAVATIITQKQLADISLNEVDAAKIKTGDKATLTFDAIDGLSITGEVAEIDTIGTVTQGVVTYNVQIAFDTQDARVKPGMSVSAAIITDAHQDVLTVPSSAIKSQGGAQYVQVFNPPLAQSAGAQGAISSVPPEQVQVQTGLSDDTNTEITSGLKEGDQIIVRTVTSSAAKTSTTQAPSILGGAGGRGGGAGGFRGTP